MMIKLMSADMRQERKVAVDSLRSVAQLLTEAYHPLHDVVHSRTDIPENHSLDTVFSAVKATADVSPCNPVSFESTMHACLLAASRNLYKQHSIVSCSRCVWRLHRRSL